MSGSAPSRNPAERLNRKLTTLLKIYSQAQLIAKRAAQQRLVEAILPEGVADSPPSIVVATAAP
jgi:hypothetical protein